MTVGTHGTSRAVRRHRAPRALTEARVREICSLVANGVPQQPAAGSLGIPARTLQNWLAIGREPNAPEPYLSFADRLEEARDMFHASRAIAVAVNEGPLTTNDRRVILDVLERRFPDQWGRVQRMNLDATVNVRPFIDANKLSLEEQALLLELLRKAQPQPEELPAEGRAALELMPGTTE